MVGHLVRGQPADVGNSGYCTFVIVFFADLVSRHRDAFLHPPGTDPSSVGLAAVTPAFFQALAEGQDVNGW